LGKARIAFARQVAIPVVYKVHQSAMASRRISSSHTSLSWRSKLLPPSSRYTKCASALTCA
jgi:hypothetical protein